MQCLHSKISLIRFAQDQTGAKISDIEDHQTVQILTQDPNR